MEIKITGFTGSRKGFPNLQQMQKAIYEIQASGCPVRVGCQRGVDGVVRSLVPNAEVFYVISPGAGSGRLDWSVAFARRSQNMVQNVGRLIGFASDPCPAIVNPKRSFVGGGSGTWASLAFAASLGIEVIVFLADGLELPPWKNGRWAHASKDGIFSEAYIWIPSEKDAQLVLF